MRGLFIFIGESFRDFTDTSIFGPRRLKDSENSFKIQKEACESHMRLCQYLTLNNLDVDIAINTCDTKFKNDLISFYDNIKLINFINKSKSHEKGRDFKIVVDESIKFIKNNLNINDYEFIFICRIDLLLKSEFITRFLPIRDKIIYPNIMSISGNVFKINNKKNCCISDVFCIIPKNYYNILNNTGLLQHHAINRLHELNLKIKKDIDFFTDRIYVANTVQQGNPLYKIVNRPEGSLDFKDNHKKKFNIELLKIETI